MPESTRNEGGAHVHGVYVVEVCDMRVCGCVCVGGYEYTHCTHTRKDTHLHTCTKGMKKPQGKKEELHAALHQKMMQGLHMRVCDAVDVTICACVVRLMWPYARVWCG